MPSLKIDNARQGFVTSAQFEQIVANLPEALKAPVTFLWWSGWRREEVMGLTWTEVDFEHAMVKLAAARSKNAEGRVLPFDAFKPIADVLYGQAERKSGALVFHRNGRPIVDLRLSWRRACKAAGCPGALIHDFRRSAARRLIAAGVPETTAMKVLGHKTAHIFRRYAIVVNDDLRNATRAIMALEAPVEAIPA